MGVICVNDETGEVLLGRRLSEFGKGYFSFPGGHMEFGESPEETACRELKEETGISPFTGAILYRVGYSNDLIEGKHYITLYVMMFVREQPQNLEPAKCQAWDWFELDDLPEPLWPPVKDFISNEYDDLMALIEESE